MNITVTLLVVLFLVSIIANTNPSVAGTGTSLTKSHPQSIPKNLNLEILNLGNYMPITLRGGIL